MGFGSSTGRTYWGRFIRGPRDSGNGSSVSVANRAFIAPISIPRLMTVDQILFPTVVNGGTILAGIYADNTDTPVGGKLLVSASPLATGTTLLIFPISFQLVPGIYWLVLICDGAAVTFVRAVGQTDLPSPFNGCFYDNAAGFALLDPCPAVTNSVTASPHAWLRVQTVDD